MRAVTAKDLYERLDEAARYGHGSIPVSVSVFSEGHGIRLSAKWQGHHIDRITPWSQIELYTHNMLLDEIDHVRDALLRRTQDRD